MLLLLLLFWGRVAEGFFGDYGEKNSIFLTFIFFFFFIQAIDVDGDGALNFFEYVSALSVMCRVTYFLCFLSFFFRFYSFFLQGNSDEKVQFAFLICDLDGSGMVEREELKNLTKHLQQLARAIMGKGYNLYLVFVKN